MTAWCAEPGKHCKPVCDSLQFLGVVGGYLVAGDDHKMVEDRIEILCATGESRTSAIS
jgi:hypothetical protein